MKSQITKNAIEASFRKLLNEKPFEKVTVKDIVEDCGLTRNTFYYYYEDIYDIVDDILSRDIDSNLSSMGSNASWEDYCIETVSLALKNPRLAEHLFKSPKKEELMVYISRAADRVLKRYIDNTAGNLPVGEDDRRLIRIFFRNALLGIVEEWLNKGMKYSLEKEIRRSAKLFDGDIRLALGRAAKS